MKVTVRLYRQHDMDLLSLYMNDSFDFTKEMRNSVVSTVRNEPYAVRVPDYRPSRQYLKRMYHIRVFIPESAQDVIKKLAGVRSGQVCSFFKAAMRACLSSFPYGAYFGGDGFTLSRAEETRLVNAERQETYEKQKEKKPARKAAEKQKKPARGVPDIPDGDTLPGPVPFENLPVPEPEYQDGGGFGDDDGMALFDAISAVSGGGI